MYPHFHPKGEELFPCQSYLTLHDNFLTRRALDGFERTCMRDDLAVIVRILGVPVGEDEKDTKKVRWSRARRLRRGEKKE